MVRSDARGQGRASRRGTSLAELIVAIGLLTIISTGAFKIMNEGLQLYRANRRCAEAQQAVLKVLTRITTDVVNAQPVLVRSYPGGGGGGSALAGIVFASPLDDNGAVKRDPDSGELFWMKWVAYYFVPGDPTQDIQGKLYRAEVPIGTAGSTDINGVVLPGLISRNAETFESAGDVTNRRLLGDDIAGFTAQKYDGQLGTAAAASTGTVHDSYDLMIEAGDKNNVRSDSYYIQIGSRVTPRG